MADKISDKKEQEIERLTRQLDHKEHELEEKYCDVGKSIMDKLRKREPGDRTHGRRSDPVETEACQGERTDPLPCLLSI